MPPLFTSRAGDASRHSRASRPSHPVRDLRGVTKLVLRIVLLFVCARFGFAALKSYAFAFREYGYPPWPLFGLGIAFALYVALRPRSDPARRGGEAPPSGSAGNVDHALLFLVLALVSSAFLLDKRGESPFTPVYFLHLSALTFFQLLLPFITAFGLQKGRSLMMMISMLILTAFLVNGTLKDPQPITRFLAETGAYAAADNAIRVLPIPIAPPELPATTRLPGGALP